MFTDNALLSTTLAFVMDSTNLDSLSPRLQKGARSCSESSVPPLVQDAEFYYESGDYTIRVGGTLFKIHRFILIRDSPVFAGLFALPQGPDLIVEGSWDKLPIYLRGDEEGSFRSLFRYIYAPALKTQANRIPITDLQDILAVAHLAHK
ncbi:hypothetical protein B0H13DRAFT_1859338 [Mycena leptocephala]|nr:hypothetical protein B0H13DRAFT_1859338 [Mycena leptocephala]